MRRAAIYARYSSDLQNPRSVDDQIALCRAFCQRQGDLAAVAEFSDRAISGASLHGRDGIEALLAFVRAKGCDVVVVEALDRVSRDLGDLATIHKQLRFAGVALLTVHDGIADQMQIAFRGLMGQMQLTDMAHKVRRGAAGKVREGKRAGGGPFGYRTIPGRPGELIIHEGEAAIVRRIFAEYAAGATPREIAAGLTAEKVPAPRGVMWRPSSFIAGVKRGDGMLANEIYRGTIVWNRVGKIKDPSTGKRVSRPNPQSEWQRSAAEHLRLVDEPTWLICAARRVERGTGAAEKHRRPKRLLSGLIRCAVCGSGMSMQGMDLTRPRAKCSRAHESRDCSNSRYIYLDALEEAVLATLREQLKAPAVIAEAAREYHAERRRLSAARANGRALNERKLGEMRRALDRLVEGVADGSLAAAAVGRKMVELEVDIARAEAALVIEPSADVVTLHPKVIDRYLSAIDALATSLTTSVDDDAKMHLRTLVDRVIVQPRELEKPLQFEIRGKLIELLAPPTRSGGTLVPPA